MDRHTKALDRLMIDRWNDGWIKGWMEEKMNKCMDGGTESRQTY